MAAKIIEETEPVKVLSTVMVIYGAPGVWKTSLFSTAESPLLFDFDKGLHRTKFRKRAVQVDTFSDVYSDPVRKLVGGCKTIGVDTAGRALDTLAVEVARENAKNANRSGGLSLQGYGVLKDRFRSWVNDLRSSGKDLVLICHEKEEKNGDDRLLRPDIQGGSYSEVHKLADMIGYLSVANGRRWLDFNPTDQYLGKNAAGCQRMEVPPIADHPNFLAGLLAHVKDEMGRFSGESAALAKAQLEWKAFLDGDPNLDQLHAKLPDMAGLTQAVKVVVWQMVRDHAANAGCQWDGQAKKFVLQTKGDAA
jgi:hypothetical protein